MVQARVDPHDDRAPAGITRAHANPVHETVIGGLSVREVQVASAWIGGVALLCVALLTERDAEFEWTQAAVISLTYLTLVGTVVAFGVYFWLLRYAPAHLLGLIAYVTPIIALTLGATIDDEPVGWHTLLGGALVFSGVGLVVRRRAAARAPEH